MAHPERAEAAAAARRCLELFDRSLPELRKQHHGLAVKLLDPESPHRSAIAQLAETGDLFSIEMATQMEAQNQQYVLN
jgi:hypothetical protein